MTLFLLVISLVANAMVMANNCDNGKSFVTDFDPAKFQKVWYSVYEPLALSPTFNHFSNDFGSNGVVSSEAKRIDMGRFYEEESRKSL
ncbi:hypothetical protein C0J52_13119 [Blattella germanica]|nr:hypothetical protein C0J52_13119 [Blattella germanica]